MFGQSRVRYPCRGRGGSWGHGVGDSKAPGYRRLSFRGRGSAIQMLLTNLLRLGRKTWWRSGSTASRQLSEVKHVPAQLVLRGGWPRWNQGSRAFSNFHLATLGVCQPPRELNSKPQRSLCRGGDPVGNRTHDCTAGVPQSRLRWLAALCFTLLTLDGIPRNSACNGTPFHLRSLTRDQQNARGKGQLHHATPPSWRDCTAVSLPDPCSCLPPVRTPASQGPTSPSSAPPR